VRGKRLGGEHPHPFPLPSGERMKVRGRKNQPPRIESFGSPHPFPPPSEGEDEGGGGRKNQVPSHRKRINEEREVKEKGNE